MIGCAWVDKFHLLRCEWASCEQMNMDNIQQIVKGGAVAEWVRALAWAGDRTVSRPGSNPATVTSLRNFGNSVYPALPVSFGGDTKSRRSLLSGVYARGSKRSHQSALECVTVVDSTTHSKLPDLQSAIMRRKTLPCTCIGRRRYCMHVIGIHRCLIYHYIQWFE